jgi:hypothetical protein
MGKQVNFYMNAEDEGEFFDFVMKTGEVVLLPRVAASVPFEPVRMPPKPTPEYPPGWPYFLFNRSLSSNLVTKLGKTSYYLDPLSSSVIEYSPSILHGSILYPGRIWAEFIYLNDANSNIRKEPRFEDWYESIAKWIKARYKQVTYTAKMTGEEVKLGIAGPSALEFLEKRGTFALNMMMVKMVRRTIDGKKCTLCGGVVEEESVLRHDGSVKRVQKCTDLKCAYIENL